MATRAKHPRETPAGSSRDRVVAEILDRILHSDTFGQADRLKGFLTYVVEESLAGRADNLKEYAIGVHVFRREESFDPRSDPIVRVQARRLRARLEGYRRTEGRSDALTIELPKGSYVPMFKPGGAPLVVKRTPPATLVRQNTVRVGSFDAQGTDPAVQACCRGLRDEILLQLVRIPNLRVLAERGPQDEPAGDPGGLLVCGSVRQGSGRIRITVHLIDLGTNVCLWSDATERRLKEALRAQQDASKSLRRRLESGLAKAGRFQSTNHSFENLAAWNLHRKGRYHLEQRTDEGLRKALEFFEKALSEDAEFALAHSGLADTYSLLAHYGVVTPREVWTKAASYATSAVMLDGRSAETHASLAHVRAAQDWDWKGAEAEFLRAIQLNPGYPTAHHWFATSCLAPLGRLDEALDEMLTALSLDPISPIIARDVARVHFLRHDFRTALEQCDHAIGLDPHFAPAYWMLGLIQAELRDYDESVAAFKRAIELSPHSPHLHGGLGRTYALAGRRSMALEVLQKLEDLAQGRYVSPSEFAWIHFALGEHDRGFEWLMKACADRALDLLAIRVDPRFDPLRDDNRLVRIVAELRLED